MLNMDVDGVWHIDVFHYFSSLLSVAKVDIIYARKIQWYFNIFRLEFQLKLQSKWESRKFPRQSAFFLAKKCRMHISFHSTSFLLLFKKLFFFVALKFMFKYFQIILHILELFSCHKQYPPMLFFSLLLQTSVRVHFKTSLLIFFIHYDKTNSSIFPVSNNQKYLLFNRFIKFSSIVKWKSLQNMNEKK